MRAREFLLEYNRQVTANQVGTNLLRAFSRDGGTLPDADFENLDAIQHKLSTLRNATPQEFNDALRPETVKFCIDSILAAIESKDPTPNKIYTPWLAKIYSKGGLKMEDMNRGDLLRLYDIGKKRRMIKPEHADINRIKSYEDFERIMLSDYDLNTISPESESKEGKASKVYEDDNVTIIVPEDEAAACKYGRNTRWCTASTRGENYFDTYNRQGKLYILIPKKPKYIGEKYQLHFETGSFMNEKDEGVDLYPGIFDRFPGVKNFFFTINPDLRYLIAATPDEILEDILSEIRSYVEDSLEGEVSPDNLNTYMEMLETSVGDLKYEMSEGHTIFELPTMMAEYIGMAYRPRSLTAPLTDLLKTIRIGRNYELIIGR